MELARWRIVWIGNGRVCERTAANREERDTLLASLRELLVPASAKTLRVIPPEATENGVNAALAERSA